MMDEMKPIGMFTAFVIAQSARARRCAMPRVRIRLQCPGVSIWFDRAY